MQQTSAQTCGRQDLQIGSDVQQCGRRRNKTAFERQKVRPKRSRLQQNRTNAGQIHTHQRQWPAHLHRIRTDGPVAVQLAAIYAI